MKKTITGQFTGLLLQHAGGRDCFRSWSFMTDHGPGILVSGPAFIAFDRRDYYSMPAGTVAPVLHAVPFAPAAPAADHVAGAGAGARGNYPSAGKAAKRRSKTLSKIFC